MKKDTLKYLLRITKAQCLSRLVLGYKNIDNCTSAKYMASGVSITIKNINEANNIIVDEVVILDGLSSDTIAAIKADIKRSYDLRMSLMPKME